MNNDFENLIENQKAVMGGLLAALERSAKLPPVMQEPDFSEDDNEASRETNQQ